MRFKLVLLSLFAMSCANQEDPSVRTPCEAPTAVGDDISFDPDVMACVNVTMNSEDFTALQENYRFEGGEEDQWPGVIGASALSCSEPYPSNYTIFSADVEMDGWQASDVGIRKKGFIGSAVGARERPSLKIDVDEYVDGQRMGDTERITLNNNHQDASRSRTCLAYSVFEDAGYPAPRCNLANVSVNGTGVGAYTHVQSVKKRFLRENFGNDHGSLYEGTIADFTDAHLAGLPERLGHFQAKTGDTDETGTRLRDIAEALKVPDNQLEAALSEAIDLDAFFVFWALETVVNHNDGYNANTNNFYVYFDPDHADLGVFIPWGADQALYDWQRGKSVSELARRLSRVPELRQRYLDELRWVLDEVWDEAVLHDRIDRFEAQVATAEHDVPYQKDSVKGLRDFVDGRRDRIEALIAEGGHIGKETQGPCTGDTDPDEFVLVAEVATVAGATCSTAPGGERGLLLLLALLGLRRRRQ